MKIRNLVIIIGIFVLAFVIRTVNLGSLPYGFHIDEAKVAWNAYSILKTGHDDHGNFLPLYYNSFGDFRPMGIFYATIPALIIFGNTVFAIRFMAALFGALSVFPLMFIFGLISREKDKKWFWIAGLFLAINPWHIMVSRATSEVVMALFLGLWALYFFIKSIKKISTFSIIFTLIFVGLSYFFYHSIRVLAPIFLIAITIFYWQEIKIRKIIKPILMIVMGSMLITFAFFWAPEARGRLSQVSILSDQKIRVETINMPSQEGPNHVLVARIFHNRLTVIIRNTVVEYSKYFGTNFLVGDEALPVRYRISNFGLITYVELILLVLSLVGAGIKKEIWLPIFLLLISPLPAAITNEDVPNLHRALFMIPFIVLLESYGFIWLLSIKKYGRIVSNIFVIALFFNLIYFGHFYLVHQKFGDASYYRNGGAMEAAIKIYQNKDNYSKIMISNSPDDLYPWLAFFNKIDPKSFNQIVKNRGIEAWNWENIEFFNDKCPSEIISQSMENSLEKILLVDTEGCNLDPILAKKQNIEFIESIRRPDISQPYLFRQKN